MDKEELEKEAEEYQRRKQHQRLYGHKPVVMKELNTTFKEAYLAGAEPREKRIAELEKENAELKAEKGCETCTKFDEVRLTKAKVAL